jgi:hypothetical protein
VAAIARYGLMGPIEREARFGVGRHVIDARAKPRLTVAGFAFSSVGPPGELASVRIEVAISTLREQFDVDFPHRCRKDFLRDVTECAGGGRMLAAQGKPRRTMIETGKNGRLPALLMVTGIAFTSVSPGGELLAVGIGMAIHTAGKPGNRKSCARPPWSCRRRMATHASNKRVLPSKGEPGLRMVEFPAGCLPPHCGMAPFAGLLEFSRVRIFVAIRACAKRESCVPHSGPRHTRPPVTQLATHLLMLTRQGEFRLIM